jgi:hypothetical protein
VLGGHQYFKEPSALTLRTHGKLITLHPREIAINAFHVAEGGRGPEDCPPLSEEARVKLQEYLDQFQMIP